MRLEDVLVDSEVPAVREITTIGRTLIGQRLGEVGMDLLVKASQGSLAELVFNPEQEADHGDGDNFI